MREKPIAQDSAASWYVVAICMAAYVLSFVDRQILSLLIGPIQADLGISDTQFGLLHGFAFAIFYATLGVPIAGFSDRMARPAVISAGIAVWSLATAACGLAGSFAALFGARVMVGAGEGALSPATQSLIADLFSREKLGRALAVYSLGSFVGAGLAFVAGGAVIAAATAHGTVHIAGLALRPWQLCFMIVGLPGLLLALIVAMTVRDPRPAASAERADLPPGIGAVFAMMRRHRAIFGPHLAGYALTGWALFGTLAWAPAVLTRAFGFDTREAGLWLGLIATCAGGGGAYASGWLMDLLDRRSGRGDGALRVGMIGGLCSALFGGALAFAPSPGTGLLLLAGLQFFSSFPIAPSGALVQIVAPPAMRARVSALLICCTSLLGAGVGTLLIGLLNDHLFGAGAGIVQSLALVTVIGGVGAATILAPGCKPLRAFVAGQRA